MLGKASDIKTELLVEFVGRTINDEIEIWKEKNPDAILIDIKFAIMPDEADGSTYREALIIYKEGESE